MLLNRFVRAQRDADYYYRLGYQAFVRNHPRHAGGGYPRPYRMEFYRGWDDASIIHWGQHFELDPLPPPRNRLTHH